MTAVADTTDTNAMEIDQGGQIQARHTCSHVLKSVTMPDKLDSFPNLDETLTDATECEINKCDKTESWVCMSCHKILCGRYANGHMIKHKDDNKSHCIAMSCLDLSFWCYGCSDYLDHLHIRRVFEFYKIAHVSKFKHEIHNIEQLMLRTDFTRQDELEKEQQSTHDARDNKKNKEKVVELRWWKGEEILSRKWAKKDEIEYDSDPEHKKKDNKSHIHKGIILKVDENAGSFGKIIVKDDEGYGNYGLEEISIKLPPRTTENTVKRKARNNKPNDLYSTTGTGTSSRNNSATSRTKTGGGTTSSFDTPSYDYTKYRGYDENDDYDAPIEYISYKKVLYRKKKWNKGDDIEYIMDNTNNTKSGDIYKGKIVSMDTEKMIFKVKLNGGDKVDIDLNKILIGVKKLFWKCNLCGFENGIRTKECMVCEMNDIEITDKSKRPETDKKDKKKKKKKEESKEDIKDDDNDTIMKQDDNDKEIKRFFVYGTLRDDDDSGKIWTAKWTMGCKAINGKLNGYKMYKQKGVDYPIAIKTGDIKDCIIGRILMWDDMETVLAKRKRADEIEGYNEENKNSLFHRDIVEVDGDGGKVKAFLYYQDAPKNLDKEYDVIPNGNWLQRKKN